MMKSDLRNQKFDALDTWQYDLLYKYHLMKEINQRNQYNGKRLENVDVTAPLSLFLDIEPVTGISQKFIFAVTIYLVHPITGQVLFLKQTKEGRVVDEYVGLGGKARSIFNGDVLKGEKISTTDALNQSLDFALKSEDLLSVACKEVMEETSTYAKDRNGNYTSEIIVTGLVPDPSRMSDIGLSKIRLILPQKAEVWMISNYLYPLSLEELEFLKHISYQNREGILEWRNIEDTIHLMSLADQIILRNQESNITVSEIRDKINNRSVIRTKQVLPDKVVKLLVSDSSLPNEYSGVIESSNNTELFSYPEWSYLSNVLEKQKVK